jgi:hypothetical protein
LKSGCHKFTIERNPSEDGCVRVNITENHFVDLYFNDVKAFFYNGYEYYLPVLDGKSKRVKGKELEYCIEIINTEINKESGNCTQIANMLNIKK